MLNSKDKRRKRLSRKVELKASCPSGKRRYRTVEEAEIALAKIQAGYVGDRTKIPQRAYNCPYCAGAHLTSLRTWNPARTPLPKAGNTLRPRSKKTAKVYRDERVPLVVEILEERPWCEIRFDANCTGRSTCVHEKRKRSQGGSLLDRVNLMASCANCNSAVEDNPVEAHDRGFVIRRGDVA